ncbi:MAG: DNA repair exonuclease [Clostridiales bacterium]|nr:DNA repair exonuclease [Clostridiales bacterium]
MVKLIHAADFHLDSAFGALPEEKARQRRQESRETMHRLVDFANEQAVELLLLAGDLFDSDQTYCETGEELSAALGRFHGQVVIAPGNHDFYSARSAYARLVWPENVHIFRSAAIEKISFPELNCTVYGAAFTAPEETDGTVLDGFQAENDGTVHLMVLHGELGVPGSRYRPLSREKVAGSGVDYLALGHIHQYSGLQRCGDTMCAYSGCIEGRGFDELGDKGFLMGTAAPGCTQLRFVPFARRRYQIIEVDITDREPLEAVREALPEQTAQDIYRIVLTGEAEESLSCSAVQKELAENFYMLEVRDRTRVKEDIWARAEEDSLRGLFLKDLRARYEKAPEDQRAQIEMAVRFGLAAMDNRDM